MISELLFYIVVLLSNIIQCITGFAGTVLAMPFSIMLIGYDKCKPILNVLGLAASLFVAVLNRNHICKRVFAKITLIMTLGVICSYFLHGKITANPSVFYKILGVIVIIFAAVNAIGFYTHRQDSQPNKILSLILLAFAGIMHGLFVCGGPLLVVYAQGQMKDKNEFRSTLSACWVVLNGIIMVEDIYFGYFTADVLKALAVSLIVLVFAIIIGNKICNKMSKSLFLQTTYVLMAISGISLIIK